MSNIGSFRVAGATEKDEPQVTRARADGGASQAQHLKGVPLFTVISCLTTVCFLMFLDSAILPTVSPELLRLGNAECFDLCGH